jgi:hypothetical protein
MDSFAAGCYPQKRSRGHLFKQLWSSTDPYQLNAGVRLQRR